MNHVRIVPLGAGLANGNVTKLIVVIAALIGLAPRVRFGATVLSFMHQAVVASRLGSAKTSAGSAAQADELKASAPPVTLATAERISCEPAASSW
jgi:hypothetical protein